LPTYNGSHPTLQEWNSPGPAPGAEFRKLETIKGCADAGRGLGSQTTSRFTADITPQLHLQKKYKHIHRTKQAFRSRLGLTHNPIPRWLTELHHATRLCVKRAATSGNQ